MAAPGGQNGLQEGAQNRPNTGPRLPRRPTADSRRSAEYPRRRFVASGGQVAPQDRPQNEPHITRTSMPDPHPCPNPHSNPDPSPYSNQHQHPNPNPHPNLQIQIPNPPDILIRPTCKSKKRSRSKSKSPSHLQLHNDILKNDVSKHSLFFKSVRTVPICSESLITLRCSTDSRRSFESLRCRMPKSRSQSLSKSSPTIADSPRRGMPKSESKSRSQSLSKFTHPHPRPDPHPPHHRHRRRHRHRHHHSH